MNRIEIGNRLKTAREDAGLSRNRVAESVEVGTTTLQQWETGYIGFVFYECLTLYSTYRIKINVCKCK